MTGLELVVLVVLFIGIVYFSSMLAVSLMWPESGGDRGILSAITSATGKMVRITGPVTVFSAVNGNPSDVNAQYPQQNPHAMGSLEADVALLIGDSGGIDFDRVNIVWVSNDVTETLPHRNTMPVSCPGWTIAGKYNIIPLKSANDNDILEPGEQFEIFACPSNTTPAYQEFRLLLEDTGGMQSPFYGSAAPVMESPVVSLM
jgi:hypothetical protein